MKDILKNKPFLTFLLADLVSNFGDILFYLALMNYVLLLPDAKYAISIITLSETLPILIAVFIGHLADKSKHKVNKIAMTQLFRFVIYLLVGVVIGFTPALWVVIVIAMLNLLSDLAGQYENGLYIPVSLKVVADDKREQTMAFRQAVTQSSALIFRTLAAALVLILSYRHLAFLNATTFLLAALITIYFTKKFKTIVSEIDQADKNLDVSHQKEKTSLIKGFIHSAKTAYHCVKVDKVLLVTLMVAPFLNGVFMVFSPLAVLMISEDASFVILNNATTIALISIITSISLVLGSILAMNVFRKLDIITTLRIICLMGIPTFLGLYLKNIYIYLIFLSLIMVFTASLSPKLNTRLMNNLPKDNLGMILGFLSTYAQVGIIVISFLFSILAAVLVSQYISLIFLVLTIMLSLYTIFLKVNK